MRRRQRAFKFTLVSVVSALIWCAPGSAQEREGYVDFRGRAYSVEDLENALFPPEGSSTIPRTRGIRPSQPAPPPRPVALNVLFVTNSDKIIPRYHTDLDKLGEVLTRRSDEAVEIAGHTDSTGTSQTNLSLSEKRAKSVKRYLVRNFSVPSERLVAKGYGPERPRASNETSQGRKENRRVEVVRVTP